MENKIFTSSNLKKIYRMDEKYKSINETGDVKV